MAATRIVIVAASPDVRRTVRDALSVSPEWIVVGEASDAYEARELVVALNPDLLVLTLNLPKMTGLQFLEKLMKYRPLPVIAIEEGGENIKSQLTAAYAAGASAVVRLRGIPTPRTMPPEFIDSIKRIVARQARRVSEPADAPAVVARPVGRHPRNLCAIGASTGGPSAIEEVLKSLSRDCAPTLIVVHMPEGVTSAYAARLNAYLPMAVREAKDFDPLEDGVVLVAPGGAHLSVERGGSGLVARVRAGEKVSGHCPSVDVLFSSVARAAGAHAVGVLLTGMGADGAQGLLEMRNSGSRTIAQDEATSAVYGMPRVAAERGAASEILPLQRIGARVQALFTPPESIKPT